MTESEATNGTVHIAGDVRMFVLGDESVFFSEGRQELYTLNTSATFIWCLLEEGRPIDSIVEEYARTFDLPHDEAQQQVGTTLRNWYGLGYISDPRVAAPATTPFTTALAFLLTNPELRNDYRASADRTCDALGVQTNDRDAFLALEYDGLEAQAAAIIEHRRQLRHGAHESHAIDVNLLAAASRAARRFDSAPDVSRCYKVLGTTFRLTLPPHLDALVHSTLVHLEITHTSESDMTVHVREIGNRCVISDGLMPVMSCPGPNGLVPCIKTLFRTLAVERYRYFIEIHAGVVLVDNRCVLLPGSSGSGKTTLTAALIQRGAKFFSDEVALLEDATLDVAPLALAMTIKAGSVDALRPFYPEIDALPEHVRDDRQHVRFLPPPVESRCDVDHEPRRADIVVFPRFERDCETAVTPLTASEGLRRLMAEALVLPELLDRQRVEGLIEWVRRLSFFDLRMSSLDEAVRAVRAAARPGSV